MSDVPIAARPAPPPLRIHHLMACAAVAAVQLSLWRLCVPQTLENLSVGNGVAMAALQAVGAVGLTLAIFSVYWQWQGFAGMVQPGQMLLVSFAVSALYFFVTMMMAMAGAFRLLGLLNLLFLPIALVAFAFYVYCAWKIADTVSWRLVFVLFAAISLFPQNLVFQWLYDSRGWSIEVAVAIPALVRACLSLCAVSLATAGDLRMARPRYWTHWTGVGLFVVREVLSVVGAVMRMLGLL